MTVNRSKAGSNKKRILDWSWKKSEVSDKEDSFQTAKKVSG
jgi:hypothetical protein